MHAWTKTISIAAPKRGRGPNSHDLTLYLFHDAQKQAEDQQRLARKFDARKKALEADSSLYTKANFYGRHFDLITDAGGKVVGVTENKEAQRQRDKMKECDFFGFLGPASLSPEKVLILVRNRDYIEKDYEGYKTRMRRPRHSLEEHLEGKARYSMSTSPPSWR